MTRFVAPLALVLAALVTAPPAAARFPEHPELPGGSDIPRPGPTLRLPAAVLETLAPAPDEVWFAVDVDRRVAGVVRGRQAVFVTPATVGKPGFETPRGIFRILRRLERDTLDSRTVGIPLEDPEGYFYPDVPHVQYFTTDGVAFHAAPWLPAHVFGREARSHGCVGLPLQAAAVFWQHGALGTRVALW
jgi:lipoprotein-anchoring transpeptidase ErfK/SrfK